MNNNSNTKKGRKPYQLGPITLTDAEISADTHIRMRGIEPFVEWCNDVKLLKFARWTYYRAWSNPTDTPLLNSIRKYAEEYYQTKILTVTASMQSGVADAKEDRTRFAAA